jgi:hypothetical protein
MLTLFFLELARGDRVAAEKVLVHFFKTNNRLILSAYSSILLITV